MSSPLNKLGFTWWVRKSGTFKVSGSGGRLFNREQKLITATVNHHWYKNPNDKKLYFDVLKGRKL